jgi:hypothetical protein
MQMAPGEASAWIREATFTPSPSTVLFENTTVAQMDPDAQFQAGVVLQRGLSRARAVHGVQSAVEA